MSVNSQLIVGNRLRAQALMAAQQIKDVEDGIKGELEDVKGIGTATKELLFLNGIKSADQLYKTEESKLIAIGVNKLSLSFIRKWKLDVLTKNLEKEASEAIETAING